MSTPVEPTAADRALERLITSLYARVEKLEEIVAQNSEDAKTALANESGALARLDALEAPLARAPAFH